MTNNDPERNIFRSESFRSIVDDAINFINQTPVYTLPPEYKFIGVGVYALFYSGKFEHYVGLSINSDLSDLDDKQDLLPIYIGKAVPPGWRIARVKTSVESMLFNRLRQHAKSINQARNLDIHDFRCRYMVLNEIESDLIGPVEAELIRRYKPLWNTVVDGFGNHDPGKGRYNQAKSEWDVLHPGRPWADRLTGSAPNIDKVIQNVKNYVASLGNPSFS